MNKRGILATTIAACVLTLASVVPSADAGNGGTPIDQFIDCRDSFWSVACGVDVDAVTSNLSGRRFDCGRVPAVGVPSDYFYQPPRGECNICYVLTIWRGLFIETQFPVCEPWPGP